MPGLPVDQSAAVGEIDTLIAMEQPGKQTAPVFLLSRYGAFFLWLAADLFHSLGDDPDPCREPRLQEKYTPVRQRVADIKKTVRILRRNRS